MKYATHLCWDEISYNFINHDIMIPINLTSLMESKRVFFFGGLGVGDDETFLPLGLVCA